MLKDRGNRTWVEPFVGGGNMIDKVDGSRIGADVNPYLIQALLLIRDNVYAIPDVITEEDYQAFKQGICLDDGLRGWVGFAMSFGGKWFGGYRRDTAGGEVDNERKQTQRAKRSAIKQSPKLQGAELVCSSYDELIIPDRSIIYCDPPYENTTKYGVKQAQSFDHAKFWEWCRQKTRDGHKVYVSEYNAPADFKCVWQGEIASNLSNTKNDKRAVEKLFTYEQAI